MTVTVAHINLAKGLRGGENQTLAIIEELSRSGFNQTLVCRKNSDLEQQAIKSKISVIAISKPFLLNVSKLKAFDLLHVHEGRSVYLALAAHYLLKKPYLITRRIINTPSNRWITKQAYKNAAMLISISKAIDEVMGSFSENQRRAVIPDMSRDLQYCPNELNRLKARFPGKFIIGHVGALDDAVKNQSLILKAAKQLSGQEDILFLLLGSGKDEVLLKNLASELGLKNIVFEGYKTNIADYYALFDIFIYPSKEEGLGSAILEVFKFKKPVIAANIGGIIDILDANGYGLLIDPNDEKNLADAIMRLYLSDSLRNHYAEAGFRRRAEFSASQICNQYMHYYRQILNIHA